MTDPRGERTPEQRREHELIRLIDDVGRTSLGDNWHIEAAIDIAKAIAAHAPRGAVIPNAREVSQDSPNDTQVPRATGAETVTTEQCADLIREAAQGGYARGLAAAQERLAGPSVNDMRRAINERWAKDVDLQGLNAHWQIGAVKAAAEAVYDLLAAAEGAGGKG